jgi:hypothetical protein
MSEEWEKAILPPHDPRVLKWFARQHVRKCHHKYYHSNCAYCRADRKAIYEGEV